MMDTLDVLVAARAEVEKGWCRFVAEDSAGNVCALGALDRVGSVNTHRPAYAALNLALPEDATMLGSVSMFNDTHTKADVVALFGRAINAEAAKTVPVSDPAHVHRTAA